MPRLVEARNEDSTTTTQACTNLGPMRLRSFLRYLLLTICVGGLLAVVFGVVGEFFIEWARERHWYDTPSEHVEAAVKVVSVFVHQAWFMYAMFGLTGLLLGTWMDYFLRRIQPAPSVLPDALQIREAAAAPKEATKPASPPKLIPLLEAATIAYEQTRNTVVAKHAEQDAKSPQDITMSYVSDIMLLKRVYGIRPPSRIIEEIVKLRLNRLKLQASGISLSAVDKENIVVYDELCVRKEELEDFIKFYNTKYKD